MLSHKLTPRSRPQLQRVPPLTGRPLVREDGFYIDWAVLPWAPPERRGPSSRFLCKRIIFAAPPGEPARILADKVPGVSGTGLDGYNSIEPFGPRRRHSV